MSREQLEDHTHARLSASGAHRWLNCPGAPRLIDQAEDRPSVYAEEGTVAHHISEQVLTGKIGSPHERVGDVIESGGFEIEWTEDMADAVQEYLDVIAADWQEGDVAEVECDLTPALRDLHPDFGGMADFIRYRPSTKHLKVTDLKFGSGVLVSAFDNTQLKYYALGALLASAQPAEKVTVQIVQPRINRDDPADEWTFDAVELVDFAADLIEAAKATEDPDAPLRTGDHCKFCPAAAFCPELEKQHHALVAAEFEEDKLPALSPEKLAEALEILPLVEERVKQIREYAYQQAMQGNPPPGYKLVEKRAMRKWADQKAAEEFALNFAGDKGFTPPKVKTPAQLEKVLPKDKKSATQDPEEGLVIKRSSGYTLAPESDKRPAAQLVSPDDFDNVGD